MTPIEILVRREIRQSGPIPFARFMELALYCPELGFYDRFPHRIGAAGDYYTSVSVGPLFGQLLAAQFARWLQSWNDAPCRIVEAGAHDGRLAHDLLAWFQQHDNPLFDRLEYNILEPSPRRRQWQEAILAPFDRRIRWIREWSDLDFTEVRGIVFANELLDAFPVHRLGWDRAAQRWFEWGVDLQQDRLSWVRLPLSQPPTAFSSPDLVADLRQHLPDGFTTEVCPAAAAWWDQAARALAQGWLLTFDYGLRAEMFFDPGRAHGTLRAYHRHRVSGELLAQPGEQDLTAQVNFTAIEQAGIAAGLRTETWTTQGRFLTRILAEAMQDQLPGFDWGPAELRQFQSLTHPDHLGARHQVLIQAR